MQMTIGELLVRLKGAHDRMSEKNDHRILLNYAMSMIVQMAKRIAELEQTALTQPELGAVEPSQQGGNGEAAPQSV